MSIAVARISESQEYSVAAFSHQSSSDHFRTGLDVENLPVLIDDRLVIGIPLLVFAGGSIFFSEEQTGLRQMVAAYEEPQGGVVYDLRSRSHEILDGQYRISEGLLLVAYLNLQELREHKNIFKLKFRSDETGNWKALK